MSVERPDHSEQPDSGVDDAALIDAARREAEAARPAPADSPTQDSPGESATAAAAPVLMPDSFAGYQLLKELHRGGQGVVYQALQKSTRRKVALKVMKEGPFATPAEEARFEREVQILGQLNHPNIVAIHDSGQAAGCHYFVMDYISGHSLDVWMAGASHSIDDTLKLFAKICAAVNAAHLRGITHRDLKPGNIRVDENGEPHILDFGLAKVAHSPEEASLMTMTGQFMGSLPWASPEQAEGIPSKVDIRTDVYSLGVILYQMLTGKFPYEVIGNMRDVLDRIMKAEPVRPSTIRKRINDEVETIVLKCLAKERERRYQSAGELARDIGHYLAGEPIEAKRDSAAYVLRKYLRKYRLPAAVAAGFVVVVTVGLAASLTFWRQAVVERGHAEQSRNLAEQQRAAAEASEAKAVTEANEAKKQRDKAERIADFMAQTLSGVGPAVARGRDTTMLREMMDAAAKRIEDGELREAPEAELRLRLSIGDTYRQIAAFEPAYEMLDRAVELARETFGAENEHYALALLVRQQLLSADGKADAALEAATAALGIYQAPCPRDLPNVASALDSVAYCLEDLGRLGEALPKYEAALELRQRLFPGDHQHVATSLNNVGACLFALDRPAEALRDFEAALEMNQRLFKGDHPDVAVSLGNVGACLHFLGRTEEALPKYEAAVEIQQRLSEGDDPAVATSLNNMAYCLQCLDRAREALPRYEAALAMRQRLFKGDHTAVAQSLCNLGSCLEHLGRAAEALPKRQAALEMHQRLFPGDHPGVAASLNSVGYCLDSLDRAAEALPKYQAALEMRQRLFKGDHRDVATSLNNAGACIESLGRAAEALPKFEAALEMRQRLYPSDHPDVAESLTNIGHCLELLGRAEEALVSAEAALEMSRKVCPPGHERVCLAQLYLGSVLADLRRYHEAEPLLFQAYDGLKLSPQIAYRGRTFACLIRLCESWDAAEPAQGHDQQAAEWRAKLAEWQASTQPASQPATVPAGS